MLFSLFLSIISQRKFLIIGIVAFILYVFIYLWAAGFLLFGFKEPVAEFFSFKILPGWENLIFQQRAPFLFESIGSLVLTPYITLFLSIPNIVLGLILSILVGANIVVGVYTFRRLGLKGGRGIINLAGTIPALLTGAACCTPLLIIIIGVQLSAVLLTAFSLFIPIAILLLFASLWWALRRIKTQQF